MKMPGVQNSGDSLEYGSDSDVRKWFNLVANEANLLKVKNMLAQSFRINIKNDSGNSGLHIAAVKGLERLAHLLINRGADFNSKNQYGDTPMALAAMNGHYRCVKLFIEHRANVNDTNNDDVSPLMLAAKNGHKNIVQLLLKNNALVNFYGKHGGAIHFATMGKHADIVKLLLKNKADVNLTTERRWTALNIAADVGSIEITLVLLAAPGIHINKANQFAMSPLLTAAFRGYKIILEALVQHLASPQHVDIYGHSVLMLACFSRSLKTIGFFMPFSYLNSTNSRGENALMIAAKNGLREIVNFFLKQSVVEIDSINNEGDTALMLAASRGYADVVDELLKRHANADCVNKAGCSALMLSCQVKSNCTKKLLEKNTSVDTTCTKGLTALLIAAEHGNQEAVKMLIKRGSEINHVDLFGESAMMKAAQNGHTDIVDILILNKASISLASNLGWTALMFALKHNCPEIVQTLLKHSADVSSVSNDGLSVLMIASTYSDSETAETLLRHKAYIHYANGQGWTSLHQACQSGKKDVVKILLQYNANIEARTDKGYTSLMLAASEGHYHVVELLLQNNANVNDRNHLGCTPLHIASESRQQPTLLKLLFEFKAGLELRNTKGYTSLLLASSKDYFQNAQQLLELGARYIEEVEKKCPLMVAIELGHVKTAGTIFEFAKQNLTKTFCARLVICAAMNGRQKILEMVFTIPGCKTDFVSEALHNAVLYGHAGVVRYLLRTCSVSLQSINEALMSACVNNQAGVADILCQGGANVEYQDQDGYTPLIKAAGNGSVQALQVLIEYNCDVNFVAMVVPHHGRSYMATAVARVPLVALQEAVQCGRGKCVEELLRAGADANVLDVEGISPLTIARMHNNDQITNLLIGYNGMEIGRKCASIREMRKCPRIEIKNMDKAIINLNEVETCNIR